MPFPRQLAVVKTNANHAIERQMDAVSEDIAATITDAHTTVTKATIQQSLHLCHVVTSSVAHSNAKSGCLQREARPQD